MSTIAELFPPGDQDAVAKILQEECGNNLPFLERADSKTLERYQLAALQLSKGTMEGLRKAVELAKTDWRDLLVAADALERRSIRGRLTARSAKEPGVNRFTAFLKRHSLVIGLMLMFLLTWPIDLANSGVLPLQVPFAVAMLVGYGFVIASITMTWLTLGRDAVMALLKRFLIWRVGVKWFLITLLLLPAVQVSAVILSAAVTKSPVDFSTVFAYKLFGPTAALPLFVLPYLFFEAFTNAEEIGWRGYALPRLQAKHTALVSSLILGVIWGFWHLPKFLTPGNTNPFFWFIVRVALESVLYTWLYNNTKGSLLMATLFHAAGNTAGAFLPIASTIAGTNLNALLIQIGLEALVVVVVTLAFGPKRLSRTEPKQVQA